MTVRNGEELPAPFEATPSWRGGALAGLVATVAMGGAITVMDLPTLQRAIAGLYGQSGNLLAGWLAHLLHGTLFGVLFAAILADPGVYRVSESVPKTVLAGLVYGVMLAVFGAGIVMPMWLDLVGFPTPRSIPHVTAPLLLWHLLYGGVLGAVFPFTERR